MITIDLDYGSASSLAIEQAAYRLAPILSLAVVPRESEKSRFSCQLEIKSDCELKEVEVVAEFRRQVNDYFLREQISAKTEGIRILLYAQAFSKAIIST
jgi:His-Xaa-Ser system protein HxsD